MAIGTGFGAVLKINTGSLTAIANVEDIDSWVMEKLITEVTAHDSTGGWAEFMATGKKKMNSFTCLITWDEAEATHLQIITSFGATTAISMSIQDPGGTEIVAFSAFITVMERMAKQDGAYRAKITIQPTGAVTIT